MQFASIIGLAVVGGMVASMVPIVTFKIHYRGTELVLQDLLDSIIPGLLPLVCTLGIYKLIKKNVSTNMLLLGCILAGFVLSIIGIL